MEDLALGLTVLSAAWRREGERGRALKTGVRGWTKEEGGAKEEGRGQGRRRREEEEEVT